MMHLQGPSQHFILTSQKQLSHLGSFLSFGLSFSIKRNELHNLLPRLLLIMSSTSIWNKKKNQCSYFNVLIVVKCYSQCRADNLKRFPFSCDEGNSQVPCLEIDCKKRNGLFFTVSVSLYFMNVSVL